MNYFSKKTVGIIIILMFNQIEIFARPMKPKGAVAYAHVNQIPQQAPVPNAPALLLAGINQEYGTLLSQSRIFDATIGKFPTGNNRIQAIAGNDSDAQARIVAQAKATYPLLHQNVCLFLDQFLQYKKQHGTNQEKSLYATMSAQKFLIRLLEQRPLMFMTENDQYLLRADGGSGQGGFETIGTENERSPLILKDYLSYDEMAVAALVGISSPTYFINNGARDNRAIAGVAGSYEREGVYVGLVGARFEKPEHMEWQHIIITPEQNTKENGYSLTSSSKGLLGLWSKLYGEKFPTFSQAQADRSGKYVLLNNGFYFNTSVYKKRIRLVLEPFLVEAHNRALLQNKKAYVHTVGLGLGVWQIDKRQKEYMLDVYAQIMKENDLSYISDIDFSWFGQVAERSKGELAQAGVRNGITIHFSQRNPADKLTGENFGKLLVACYAWDGNAYPGNEYWAGMLTASGDPAAACCSTIPELQNLKINPYIQNNSAKIMRGVAPVYQETPVQQTPAQKKLAPKKAVPAAKRKASAGQQRRAPARRKRK